MGPLVTRTQELVNLDEGTRSFTQVRPLCLEVKTYFLLVLYCCGLVLDYKIPAPLTRESATTGLVLLASLLIQGPGPPL